jgi:hypothetical protein
MQGRMRRGQGSKCRLNTKLQEGRKKQREASTPYIEVVAATDVSGSCDAGAVTLSKNILNALPIM